MQNANSYDEGLSPVARQFIALGHGIDGAAAKVHELLTLEATKGQYLHGISSEECMAPDGWTLDQHFLDWLGRKQILVDLALDYHTNLALYPTWQAWLRRQQPPLLVLWGQRSLLSEGRGTGVLERCAVRRVASVRDRALCPGGIRVRHRTADCCVP
jgi:hypothetical protein